MKLRLPYIHTTLLIDELTKLQHEEAGGKVKIYEKSGMRKDRYSSLAYNYYVATQIENKISKRYNTGSHDSNIFVIRPPKLPKYTGKAVNSAYGRHNHQGWER